jgi:GDP/UDP-N,N'-diacetylbacillosamine 2-epimerase (hydrolysing)
MPRTKHRRICFVTGSRAEFGLMRTVLLAIQKSKKLKLQIVVTGMHLDRRHGQSIKRIENEGWKIDALVPWKGDSPAEATGNAIAGLSRTFEKLRSDIVLVVGDRVEAFAAAAAGHISGLAVAHVHGGDRAMGQVDDSLRHAITKLAHLHFPATRESADRIVRMGEERSRVHRVGSPGIDGIHQAAGKSRLKARAFALLVLHPVDADEGLEFERAGLVLRGLLQSGIPQIVIIYPNNDPGSGGIIRCWESVSADPRLIIHRDVSRPLFLGLLRDAALLAGNSSAGIIEAASFGTPVVDVGPRQQGRQRCEDVRSVPYRQSAVAAAARGIWNSGKPLRAKGRNPYAAGQTGAKIARILSSTRLDPGFVRKLIAY